MYMARNRITHELLGIVFEEKKQCQKFINDELQTLEEYYKSLYGKYTTLPIIMVYDLKKELYVD